jgi:hypothetical protein
MEVHAHTHTSRKKWTHYFWEFLMLFLAVFCGFLAEYQLEHKIERDREKDYMEGMLDDLSEDTVSINEVFAFAKLMSKGLDSLKQNLYNTNSADKNVHAIYRQYGAYLRRFSIRVSDQTATQLRNSGQLRLVRKKEVTNKISGYWKMTGQVEAIQGRIESDMDEIALLGDNIINGNFLGSYSVRDSLSGIRFMEVFPGAELMTNDKNTLINLANKISRLKRRIDNFYFNNLSRLKRLAVDLIELIKKEYHLN